MELKISQSKDGVLIGVRVQPGAKKNRVVGLHDGNLKIAVAAPPVDGKANEAVLDFLSELFGIRRSQIQLERGDSSRQKTILVKGISAAVALERTGQALS